MPYNRKKIFSITKSTVKYADNVLVISCYRTDLPLFIHWISLKLVLEATLTGTFLFFFSTK